VATVGETKQPEEGCLLVEGARCRGNRWSSRAGGESGIGWQAGLTLELEPLAGDAGVRGSVLWETVWL
jgi:hypothetical protein